MRSRNSAAVSPSEDLHLGLVKSVGCVVCDAGPPNDAHHPVQGLHRITIALCWDCHQGPHGWHGDKSRWRAAKMTEPMALNETLRRVDALRSGRPLKTANPPPRSRQNSARTPSKIIPRAA